MALTIVDNRDVKSEVDATTGWTATDGPNLFTTQPNPIEASGCLGLTASNATQDGYIGITSDDFSGGGTLSVWIQDRAEFDLTSNVGVGIQVGDGTNRIAYAVGGSDGTAFRHDVGPVKWACFLLDLANKPANFAAIAGSEASLDEAAITQVGVYFKTLVKSVGGADNCFWDIIRWADPGVGIEVYGGTVGTPETLATLAGLDRSTGTLQAYGIVRELSTGVYGIQGNINLGDPTSTNDTYIDVDTETISWEDRGLSTANYYRFVIAGNATGTTVVNILNSTLSVAGAASASFDASDTNITFNATGSTFVNFGDGITTGGSTQDWTSAKFINCDQIITNGADLSGADFSGYEGTAGTAYLVNNLSVDPDGELDNTSFTKGTAATHAIEFGANTPSSITLRGGVYSGYNAANGNNDSTFYNNTGGALTINVVGATGNVTYRNGAGASTTIVADPVTLLVTVQNTAGTKIQDARVLVLAASPGNYPVEDVVTITSSGTTASVSHTTHGMVNGDKVVIENASPNQFNGVYTISNVATNSYDYTFAGNSNNPATGTILATTAIISGLTDVSGQISDTRTYSIDQTLGGRVRKSSGSPYYKTGDIVGTIDNANGLPLTVILLSDE